MKKLNLTWDLKDKPRSHVKTQSFSSTFSFVNSNPLQTKVTIWDFFFFFDNKDWQAKPQFSTSQYANIIKMRPFVKEEGIKRKKNSKVLFQEPDSQNKITLFTEAFESVYWGMTKKLSSI